MDRQREGTQIGSLLTNTGAKLGPAAYGDDAQALAYGEQALTAVRKIGDQAEVADGLTAPSNTVCGLRKRLALYEVVGQVAGQAATGGLFMVVALAHGDAVMAQQ